MGGKYRSRVGGGPQLAQPARLRATGGQWAHYDGQSPPRDGGAPGEALIDAAAPPWSGLRLKLDKPDSRNSARGRRPPTRRDDREAVDSGAVPAGQSDRNCESCDLKPPGLPGAPTPEED
jgi:hypothetical protein